MTIKYFLALIACIISLSFSTYSLTETYTSHEFHHNNIVMADYWVLEYHNNAWWWVLYDGDGVKIMEIPAEF